jgi:hypothetical protein
VVIRVFTFITFLLFFSSWHIRAQTVLLEDDKKEIIARELGHETPNLRCFLVFIDVNDCINCVAISSRLETLTQNKDVFVITEYAKSGYLDKFKTNYSLSDSFKYRNSALVHQLLLSNAEKVFGNKRVGSFIVELNANHCTYARFKDIDNSGVLAYDLPDQGGIDTLNLDNVFATGISKSQVFKNGFVGIIHPRSGLGYFNGNKITAHFEVDSLLLIGLYEHILNTQKNNKHLNSVSKSLETFYTTIQKMSIPAITFQNLKVIGDKIYSIAQVACPVWKDSSSISITNSLFYFTLSVSKDDNFVVEDYNVLKAFKKPNMVPFAYNYFDVVSSNTFHIGSYVDSLNLKNSTLRFIDYSEKDRIYYPSLDSSHTYHKDVITTYKKLGNLALIQIKIDSKLTAHSFLPIIYTSGSSHSLPIPLSCDYKLLAGTCFNNNYTLVYTINGIAYVSELSIDSKSTKGRLANIRRIKHKELVFDAFINENRITLILKDGVELLQSFYNLNS